MQIGVFPIGGGRQKMGGTGVYVGSVPSHAQKCFFWARTSSGSLPLPARPIKGWTIVIDQRVNKDAFLGGRRLPAEVFEMNYFRKP